MQADLELQEILKNRLKTHPGTERELAEMLQVSIPTIKRWVDGKTFPHLVMARAIVIFLKEKLEPQAE